MHISIQRTLNILFIALVLLLTSCSGGGCGSTGGGTTAGITLSLDQVSTVPLINNQPQSFYVYANNTSDKTMSDIAWSIDSESASTSIVASVKSKLNHLVGRASNDVGPISIVDTSECVSVAPGQSCRILLQASSVGIFQLTAASANQSIKLLGGAGVVQVDTYIPVNTGDPADMLIITPLSEISYSGGIGSGSFFIINQGESSVSLDIDALQSEFPANASLVLGNCPNPLPGSYACQVRVIITNPTASEDQDLTLPITLSGDVINSDNTTTRLPKQNGDSVVTATSKVKGIIQYQASQSVIIDNSFANLTTTSVNGVISNIGSGTLTINSLTPSGNILSIANDRCSSKTLGQGEMCSYTINLNVAQITNSSNQSIVIGYTDEAGGSQKSVTSTINWTYIEPLPEANPSINLVIGSNSLNQSNLSTILTITNNGNVALSNITAPTISPANSRVVISNGNNPCTNTLAVGSSCNYTVTYNPVAPSEDSSITLGSISATHPDNRGGTSTTTFSSNNVGVNLDSIFEGLLTSSGVVSLSENVSSGTVTFTNTGNYIATVSGISLANGSSSNLSISGGSCSNNSELGINQSCTVTLSLLNSQASGSGNGTLVVTYNNNNGTTNATSDNANISWLIGQAPSLQVTFASNSLTTPITLESSTMVTLTNNGRDDLTNIVIPTLTTPLAYASGTTNGCAIDGTQNLAIGASCTLTLSYSPISAQVTRSESLASFRASYTNQGNPTTYTTNPYAVTITAIALGDLTLSTATVTQSVNWVTNTQTSTVLVTNTGGIPVTMSTPTIGDSQITTTGCASGTLQPLESCTLSVIGNYNSSASNLTINGVITLNYADQAGSKTETLNVIANYSAMPVVTGGLTVVSPSLFTQNLSVGVNESRSYAIALTNTTSATNGGLESISIPYNSLIPVDGNGVTYSINTTGITTNPCSLPTSGNSMTLASNATCNYHLVLNTGSSTVASTSHDLSTDYSYYNYTGSSITPGLTGSANVTNSFNLAVTSIAQLAIAVVSGEENNFASLEQGFTYPTMEFTITNNGTGPVIGAVTEILPPGFSGDFSSCDNLAVGATCNVTLRMETDGLISGNLNTGDLSYNNGEGVTTADFPSISYSVITPDSPQVFMTAVVTGCFSGDGTSSTCLNNPDSAGGDASSMQVVLTFFNNSSTVIATSLSLPATEEGLFTTAGYQNQVSTCSNGIGIGGTCTITYDMPATASTQGIQPDIASGMFNYDYTYTSPQGQSLTGSNNSPLFLFIDVLVPSVSIEPIDDIIQGESGPLDVSFSDWYQGTPPNIRINTVSDITFDAIGCGIDGFGGAGCFYSIETTGSTPIATYTAEVVMNSVTVASQSFEVVAPPPPRLVIFVTNGGWDGNLGGFAGADAKCNADSNKPATPVGATYKALLAGNNATVNLTSYYRTDLTTLIATATGGDLVGLNQLDNSIQIDDNWPWTGANGANCSGWTSSNSSVQGDYGFASTSSSSWWYLPASGGSDSCGYLGTLYCVQQP